MVDGAEEERGGKITDRIHGMIELTQIGDMRFMRQLRGKNGKPLYDDTIAHYFTLKAKLVSRLRNNFSISCDCV